jgi:hypothetical protein
MFESYKADKFVVKGKINGEWNEKQSEKQIKWFLGAHEYLQCFWVHLWVLGSDFVFFDSVFLECVKGSSKGKD